ncbi:RsmE family RNA methyltransferase [Rubrobacter xylanophilus]|uniref:RsmE family RNA methyltransferase n=1 Tax=Rubrobacter xylanophilus TaxID=49319 RepID=UPI00155B24E5|nr:RsmE family RNA methyltransferase [Rubrobacter xylanophilus]
MTRIFLEDRLEPGEVFALPRGEDHHLRRVLRARSGERFEAVDAVGRLFMAELREGASAEAVELLNEAGVEERAEVWLYQAVPKGKRMDLLVEKATEVGVAGITPLVCERSVVRPGGNKVERWRRIAESAARQALRLRVPEVREPVVFREAVREVRERGVLLHNSPGLDPLEERARGAVALLVGPEGGWSANEIEEALRCGLSLAQLGPFRLRSETAGVVAVARVRAMLENGTVTEDERSHR